MVCKDAAIKVLDLKHICRLGSKASSMLRIYSAPEVYLSGCSIAADYYSAGILLTEMVVGKSLDRHYAERHIDVKTIMTKESCSQKLKDILVKATSFEPGKRYLQSGDLLGALDKCPEFRGMKRIPIPKSKDGTVTGRNIRDTRPEMSIGDIFGNTEGMAWQNSALKNKTTGLIDLPEQTQISMPASGETTMIYGNVYFDEKKIESSMKSAGAYLVRQSNNERIVLNKPVFKIGGKKSMVDYCLGNTMVSRLHAELVQSTEGFYIRDLNSTNGTYVNSEKIVSDKARRIMHGDQIRIGNEEFVFNEY